MCIINFNFPSARDVVSDENHRKYQDQVTVEELEEFHQDFEKDATVSEQLLQPKDTEIVTNSTFRLKIKTDMKIEHQGEFKKRYPQAIIGGVKKCGTRALLAFLARHPSVRSAGKEVHFFDKNASFEKGYSWYLEQMPESYENEITVEKSPAYFVKPFVPERVLQYMNLYRKNLKLIFIFRNPVKRAVSDYAQGLERNKMGGKTFEEVIFEKGVGPKKVSKESPKVSVGIYSEHLRRWIQHFPLSKMLFVNGDEFIRNPSPTMKRVQKFLEIKPLIGERSFKYNATKGFYCIVVQNANKEETEDCLGPTKGRKHPEVSNESLEKLREFYKPYNDEFFSIINQKFEGW